MMHDERCAADDPSRQTHYRLLEAIYHSAPVTRLYGSTLMVKRGAAVVTMPVDASFFHAANALHGSVYFRALDDAAFFATNSVEFEVLVLTTSFRVDFLRPVRSGILTATGTLLHHGSRQLVARSELRQDDMSLVAIGVGTFIRGRAALAEIADRQGIARA